MVRKVESFESELQLLTLSDAEILQRGKIPVDYTEADECIPAHVAQSANRLKDKHIRVEELFGVLPPTPEGDARSGGIRAVGSNGGIGDVGS